jgi:hypothetical protein
LGIGLTTTVACIGVPKQVSPALVNSGVTVNVTVTGALVVLVNVPAISPAPLAAIPVTATVLSLVQLYTVPATLPVKAIVVIADPLHIVCVGGVATAFGIGFTTTVALTGVPKQVRARAVNCGVIVKVTVIGALVVLVNEPAISPEPAAAIPLTGPPTSVPLSLVQLYTVPGTAPVKTMVAMAEPLQIVCAAGVGIAFGTAFTVTVCDTDCVQPGSVGLNAFGTPPFTV